MFGLLVLRKGRDAEPKKKEQKQDSHGVGRRVKKVRKGALKSDCLKLGRGIEEMLQAITFFQIIDDAFVCNTKRLTGCGEVL